MSVLFIGGIPLDMDEVELKDIFSEYGTVIEAKVLRNKRTKISRRFGFVEMATEQEAERVIGLLDGGSIDDAEISVKREVPVVREIPEAERKRESEMLQNIFTAIAKKVAPRAGKRPRIKKPW